MNANKDPVGGLSKQDELSIVHAITIAVAEFIELDSVLTTALDKVMEAFNVRSAGIYLIDNATGRLVLRASRGLTPGFLAEKSDVPPGSGCAGWAVDHGEIFAAFGTPEASYICEDAERLMKIDCLLASPIISKSGVQGVIELFAPTSRRLKEKEAALIKVISDQVGIAIENARLYEESRDNVLKLTELQKELAGANRKLKAHLTQEIHIAEMLQKCFLPRRLPEIPGISIATRLISATEAADVGGDFYDFIELKTREGRELLAIVLGDVCGSGIEAATLTSVTKHTIRAFAYEDQDVAHILERANRTICEQAEASKFVALFLGVLDIDTLRLHYCVAGQPLPVVVREGAAVIELEHGAIPLGIEKDIEFDVRQIDLRGGDTLTLFTDGLIEARRGSQIFGSESVEQLLSEYRETSLDSLVDKVISAARTFSGGPLKDDVAVVSLRFTDEGDSPAPTNHIGTSAP